MSKNKPGGKPNKGGGKSDSKNPNKGNKSNDGKSQRGMELPVKPSKPKPKK